jgi:zinc protease
MDLLNIPYVKYRLANSLEVILSQNNSLPFTAINIWYKTGSANEVKGKTGLAHLFEHMMFQGSKNVAKEMHFRYIQEAGGTLNASTSFDRTNYFEKLPSNDLELALWLESDRMGFFIDALTQEKLDNQKSVVLNERLERYDNQPYGLAWEKIISNLYPPEHPYSWSTIGFYNDIESFTLNDVETFFKKHYSPSKASLVVAGNFDIDKTKSLIEKYFAELKSNGSHSEVKSEPFKLDQNKKLTFEDKVNLERIYLAWPTKKSFEADDAALDILSDVLAGSKNARLTRKLVYEMEIAQDVSAMQFSGKYGGHFMIITTVKPGKNPEEIKEIIFKEISSLSDIEITSRELQRSKNVIKSNFVYSLQNLDTIADLLNLYNYYLGEPNSFNFDLNRYTKVDEKKIKGVVNNYLNKSFVELRIIPERKNVS